MKAELGPTKGNGYPAEGVLYQNLPGMQSANQIFHIKTITLSEQL